MPLPFFFACFYVNPILEKLATLDQRLVRAARDIHVLSSVAWPKSVQEKFLSGWQSKNPSLPRVNYACPDHSKILLELESIILATDSHHSLGKFLQDTAKSYRSACLMLQAMGTDDFTRHSIEIYGKPDDKIQGSRVTSLTAAQHFIQIADQFELWHGFEDTDYCVSAEMIRADLETAVQKVIPDQKIEFVIDPHLSSKASAGPKRVRLRAGTAFSRYDFKQFLEHEVFIHSLTSLNGLAQPHIKSLSLGAPRTVATQEGLATFAELITNAMDLPRLKRIALRIIATEKALEGADFIEIFRFFLDSGQDEHESYLSAMRIFRGGNPQGGIVFTKDTVYLNGLIRTHNFFRWAMQKQSLDLGNLLFCGKLAIEDTLRLEPFVDQGWITPPKYLPPWFSQFHTLAATLAFSVFTKLIVSDDPTPTGNTVGIS